jgi:type IV secretion system protein VirB6
MSGACTLPSDTGAIRAVLWSVDCNTRDFTQRGWEALAGGATFQTALTTALVIYVALIGWRMMFAPDGAHLSEAPRTAIKIGTILALVTSWSLFQTLVFDVAARTPAQIAELVSASSPTARAIPDPVGELQLAYDQMTAASTAFAAGGDIATKPAPPPPGSSAPGSSVPTGPDPEKAEEAARAIQASHSLANAAELLLLVHTGLVAASWLMIDILGAVAPLFIALFLFRQTRGFFVGWVRAMTAAALISATSWILILLMLRTLDPWLVMLAEQRSLNQLDPHAGTSAASLVEVFSLAQAALAIGAGLIAFAFRLPRARRTAPTPVPAGARQESRTPVELTTRATLLADQLRRFDQIFEARGRAAGASAILSPRAVSGPVVAAGRAAPTGDIYRRAVLTGPGRRPGGRS